jgi:hypothetical protein
LGVTGQKKCRSVIARSLSGFHGPTYSGQIERVIADLLDGFADATVVGFDNVIAPNGHTLTLPPHSDGGTIIGDEQTRSMAPTRSSASTTRASASVHSTVACSPV